MGEYLRPVFATLCALFVAAWVPGLLLVGPHLMSPGPQTQAALLVLLMAAAVSGIVIVVFAVPALVALWAWGVLRAWTTVAAGAGIGALVVYFSRASDPRNWIACIGMGALAAAVFWWIRERLSERP